jgi:integrase
MNEKSKKTSKIHGSIYLNGGRYWWKVKLPGQAVRSDHPLIPHGATLPTKDRGVAEEIARLMWNKALAEGAAAEGARSLDGGTVDDGTVASLIVAYKAYIARRYVHPDGTQTGQVHRIMYALRYFERFEGMNVEDVNAKMLEDWLVGLTMKSLSDPDRGLCRKLANEYMREVRRMFKWGVRRGRVPEHVYWSLTLVEGLRKGQYGAREAKKVISVNPAIVERTLPFCTPVVADMVRMQLLTGMRPGEVCMMRPCDIDMSGEVWIYRPAWHKTSIQDKDRQIPLGPQARAILEAYLARRTDQHLFSPAEAMSQMRLRRTMARKADPNAGNKVGTNRKDAPAKTPGDRYTALTFGRAIKYAVEKANRTLSSDEKIPHWHPYQIRHTVANLVSAEYGEQAAKNYLGHATLETTRRHYLERDLKQAVEVSLRIG